MPNSKKVNYQVTIVLDGLDATVIKRALSDPRMNAIAIDWFATKPIAELIKQLPGEPPGTE